MEAEERILSEEEFRNTYKYAPVKKRQAYKNIVIHICRTFSIFSLFPILTWLPKYNLKKQLPYDTIAGLTVSVIHIPQGLAYALLANVHPIYGLYMSVFPVLIYIIMGTSLHISTGPFAVLCMMVGSTISTYIPPAGNMTQLEITSTVTFMIGAWQLLLGLLQLGFIAVLFSEVLVSGFMTGVAIHVVSSQVKSLLGLKLTPHYGAFKLIYMYYEIFANITSSNWVEVVMSCAFIVFLVTFNEAVKPQINKLCTFPVPIELIAIVLGGLFSFLFDMEEEYNIRVVGTVPTGMPTPFVPNFSIMGEILVPTIIYAFVACAMNLSLGKIYARKNNYEIRANQEFLAFGFGNIFGSFMNCLPYASSMSRTAIQVAAGSQTQLTSAISCAILIIVLLSAGPLFYPIPHCVLAVIIVVALKNMLLQVTEFPGIFRASKVDGLIWMSTFLSVVILDLDYGLGIGLLLLIISILVKSMMSNISSLGQVPQSDIFLDLDLYKAVEEVPNVTVLRMRCSFTFSNCDQIRDRILLKVSKANIQSDNDGFPNTVVLDFVSVTYVDPAGVKALGSIHESLVKMGYQLFLCGCNVNVYNNLQHCKFFDKFPKENVFFSLSDAVAKANERPSVEVE